MLEIDEILSSASFWILTLVGYGSFIFMLMILKGMDQTDIMPWWVKLITIIAIPIAAVLFSE